MLAAVRDTAMLTGPALASRGDETRKDCPLLLCSYAERALQKRSDDAQRSSWSVQQPGPNAALRTMPVVASALSVRLLSIFVAGQCVA